MILYGYALSSASFRVRVALALKNLPYDSVIKNLKSGEQRLSDYLNINSQGFVPSLALENGAVLSQSLAIIEYLDETHPLPALLPQDPLSRARVRALAQAITSDLHPLNNLRVLRHLEEKLGLDRAARNDWYRHWVEVGFAALERWLAKDTSGRFCHGDTPSLADICLVPQVFNARRFSVDLNPYPRILAIDAECRALPAFQIAAPNNQ